MAHTQQTLHLLRHEPVSEGLPRIARAHVDASLQQLRGDERGSAVHDVRKMTKQLRAMARLVRVELGEPTYAQTNARFRELARPLSEVRDAEALVQALDALCTRHPDLTDGRFVRLREALVARRDALEAAAVSSEGALSFAAQKLEEAHADLGQWTITHPGWKALSGGLSRAYRRARKALHAAKADPTNENLHRWRKDVKVLRGQLLTLRPHWPAAIGELVDDLKRLAELLGDDHDLVVLGAVSRSELASALDASEAELLAAMIAHRRGQLQKKAFRRGKRCLARRPRAVVHALHGTWRAWHDA